MPTGRNLTSLLPALSKQLVKVTRHDGCGTVRRATRALPKAFLVFVHCRSPSVAAWSVTVVARARAACASQPSKTAGLGMVFRRCTVPCPEDVVVASGASSIQGHEGCQSAVFVHCMRCDDTALRSDGSSRSSEGYNSDDAMLEHTKHLQRVSQPAAQKPHGNRHAEEGHRGEDRHTSGGRRCRHGLSSRGFVTRARTTRSQRWARKWRAGRSTRSQTRLLV